MFFDFVVIVVIKVIFVNEKCDEFLVIFKIYFRFSFYLFY